LSKVEHADRLQVFLHQVHLLNELGYKLDQRVKFVPNSPATLTHDLLEQITLVRNANHRVGELSVAEDLRVTERVLIGHLDLERVR